MEVSCPRCRAHLILPAQVVGQSVCCPKCHAVLRAESDRLVAPDAVTAPAPVAPRPAGAAPQLPEMDEEQLDLTIPPGHVFPAQRNAEILRNLSWVGLWMRIVAAGDLLSVFAIVALVHAAMHPHNRLGGEAVMGVLCGLTLVGPVATLLWMVGGLLMEAKLHGGTQPAALAVGLGTGALVGLVVSMQFLSFGARGAPFGARGAPNGLEVAAAFIAGAMALATFLVSLVAVYVRRAAITAHIPERLGEPVEEGAQQPIALPGPASLLRSPQQVVRGAARSLRLASMMLVLWYPLSCCCCGSVQTNIRHGSLYWLSLLWAAGLLPLALMLGAAYYLEQMRRPGAVIAGSVAALLVSFGFAIDFIVTLVQLTRPQFGEDVPFVLLAGAVALAVALSSLIGGLSAWQAVHDPEVRRAFARNR